MVVLPIDSCNCLSGRSTREVGIRKCSGNGPQLVTVIEMKMVPISWGARGVERMGLPTHC